MFFGVLFQQEKPPTTSTARRTINKTTQTDDDQNDSKNLHEVTEQSAQSFIHTDVPETFSTTSISEQFTASTKIEMEFSRSKPHAKKREAEKEAALIAAKFLNITAELHTSKHTISEYCRSIGVDKPNYCTAKIGSQFVCSLKCKVEVKKIANLQTQQKAEEELRECVEQGLKESDFKSWPIGKW